GAARLRGDTAVGQIELPGQQLRLAIHGFDDLAQLQSDIAGPTEPAWPHHLCHGPTDKDWRMAGRLDDLSEEAIARQDGIATVEQTLARTESIGRQYLADAQRHRLAWLQHRFDWRPSGYSRGRWQRRCHSR